MVSWCSLWRFRSNPPAAPKRAGARGRGWWGVLAGSLGGWALALTAGALAADLPADEPRVTLLTADDRLIEFIVSFPPVVLDGSEQAGWAVRCSGVPADAPEDGRFWPVWHTPVALPPEGEYRVSAHITPGEHLSATVSDLAVPPDAVTAELALAPSPDRGRWADPLGFVQESGPGRAAGLRVLGLRLYPVRPSEDGRLRTAREILVRVSLAQGSAGVMAGAGGARATTAGLQSAVVNPGQVPGWMRVPPLAVRPAARQAEDSFTSSPNPWVRIEVQERGLYRITWEDLAELGIDPSEISLETVRLFCSDFGELSEDLPPEQWPTWMNPCAVRFEGAGGSDVWTEEAAVLFLGNGPDGWREHLGLPASEADPYYVHPYSDHMTYWMTWGGTFETEPRRIAEVGEAPGAGPEVTTGGVRLHVERQRIHESRPRESNLVWERFFWAQLIARDPAETASIDLDLEGIVPGGEADLRVSLWGANWEFTRTPNHRVAMMVDTDTLAIAEWDRVSRAVLTDTLALAPGEESFELLLAVTPRYYLTWDENLQRYVPKLHQDNVFLAYVEAAYQRQLDLSGGVLEVTIPADSIAAGSVRVTGLASDQDYYFLETSDPYAPELIAAEFTPGEEGSEAHFALTTDGTPAHLLCLRGDQIQSPAALERRDWGTARVPLRDLSDPVDYLVVTTEALEAEGRRLAAHRADHFWGADGRTLQSGRVAVVTMEVIFEEFSWGQFDPTALRNFLHHAYHNWLEGSAPALSHVVFLGDAHFDSRNYLGGNATMTVPAYEFYAERYATSRALSPAFFGDTYFSLLDGPTDRDPEFALGRLPVGSVSEAAAMIDKLIAYDLEASPGVWKSRVVLCADDVCQGNHEDGIGVQHVAQSEDLSTEALPPGVRQEKLYLYDYGSECAYLRKPQASADLIGLLEEGTLLLNFVGHGSETQIADERILEISSMAGLQNAGRPFLMITASCAVGKYAHGGDGLALAAMRHRDGGALAVVSAAAVAFSGENAVLNLLLLEHIFSRDDWLNSPALGPAYYAAKVAYAPGSVDNEYRYNLMGDPGSRLALPSYGIELTLADVPEVAADADTLLRGATARVAGRVIDGAGQTQEAFDGRVRLEVFDSATLATAVDHRARQAVYEQTGARLFASEVEVSGGRFESVFFVPTALITGTRGDARIHAYAYDAAGASGLDAAGYRRDLLIPEYTVPVSDTLGPAIELAWEDPDAPRETGSRLTAVMRDSSGIYVTGLAPSRSVVVSIRDEFDRVLVAEDLAQTVTFGSDFREAEVGFALPAGLPAGEPLTLTLEASDNVGQRSAATVTFALSGSAQEAGPLLGQVYNLPNPTESGTRFLFDLGETADVEIALYTVTGRKIKTLSEFEVTPARGRSEGVAWDGRDEDGDRLANGVYFYRVVARTSSGQRAEKIERLAVYR